MFSISILFAMLLVFNQTHIYPGSYQFYKLLFVGFFVLSFPVLLISDLSVDPPAHRLKYVPPVPLLTDFYSSSAETTAYFMWSTLNSLSRRAKQWTQIDCLSTWMRLGVIGLLFNIISYQTRHKCKDLMRQNVFLFSPLLSIVIRNRKFNVSDDLEHRYSLNIRWSYCS